MELMPDRKNERMGESTSFHNEIYNMYHYRSRQNVQRKRVQIFFSSRVSRDHESSAIAEIAATTIAVHIYT